MATPLLSVEGLTVDFDTAHGGVRALHGVSFDLHKGEALGIVGESGSGKTVACRALLRLLSPNARITGGSIRLGGSDVLAMSEAALTRLRGERAAMIFQNPATHLDPIMTVGRQIEESLMRHRRISRAQARVQAIKLLADMQIGDPVRRVNSFSHELSGGMRQRVMIAAALACQPDLLIADEPTTALDVTIQAQILDLLRAIRRERHLSLILVSHDLGVIAGMCDRVVVMKDGSVVETGSLDQIVTAPRQNYTQQLIASHAALLRPVRREACVLRESSAPILTVENLSVAFTHAQGFVSWLTRRPDPSVKAVDNVSFVLQRGRSLGIVGESGSGKSTIARTIVGLVPMAAGRVLLNVRNQTSARDEHRFAVHRRIQMVFQDPFLSLNPAFTVAETLAEPLRQHMLCRPNDIKERILELMRRVELPKTLLSRRSGQLSGGQRQRVGIARALALEPEILIADEVTSALDVTIQAQILALFARLRDELDLTLLLISHDLGVVRYLCDDIAVMKSGKFVEYGPTEEVLRHPRENYTQALIAAIPRLRNVAPHTE
jgi:ABC-type glutathione transport system ATPase component